MLKISPPTPNSVSGMSLYDENGFLRGGEDAMILEEDEDEGGDVVMGGVGASCLVDCNGSPSRKRAIRFNV
jgi:hypothetical protein